MTDRRPPIGTTAGATVVAAIPAVVTWLPDRIVGF